MFSFTVILLKGHNNETRYEHDTEQAAVARADALVELHGRQRTSMQEVLTPHDGWEIWVDASHYYSKGAQS